MALLLTRLAGPVGIDLAADPIDGDFEDIGGLMSESQTAITQGTSATTSSPADAVIRGQVALFISHSKERRVRFSYEGNPKWCPKASQSRGHSEGRPGNRHT